MPCYNEKKTIAECLRRVFAVDLGGVEKEIIIVDDGSTDGTIQILKGIKDDSVKVIHHSKNLGKGSAIKSALPHVTGDIVIIQDADLEYDPKDYVKLFNVIINDGAKVVYGSRILHDRYKWSSFAYGLGGIFITFFTNFLYGSDITDGATCYKMFRADLIKGIGLKAVGFEFCPEITSKILKKGLKIHEVPISYFPRTIREGKKIKWRHGIEAIWTLLKYRFS